MNNKGFTLVELLAIMVIISVVIAIVTISVGPIIKNYEKNLSKTQISIIEEAANIYYLKEGIKKSYENRNFKLCVNVEYLIENDYIEDESIKSMYDNEKLEGSVEITYKSDEHTYKYKENSCTFEYENLDEICMPVTEKTKTTGNIPTGEYNIGDEYICEVKDKIKYHFFVVSADDDNVNLIMERNVYYNLSNNTSGLANSSNPGLVLWYLNENHSYGPVTAMNYLHNATKTWDNVPNIKIDYDDENINYNTQQKGNTGYGSIKTTKNITIITNKNNQETGRIENLKARLPRYDEVHGTGKCLTYTENGNQFGSCPLWLSNYLDNSEYINEEKMQNIIGINGYWILSTSDETVPIAWAVSMGGYVIDFYVDYDDGIGVRPVISVPKLDIAN